MTVHTRNLWLSKKTCFFYKCFHYLILVKIFPEMRNTNWFGFSHNEFCNLWETFVYYQLENFNKIQECRWLANFPLKARENSASHKDFIKTGRKNSEKYLFVLGWKARLVPGSRLGNPLEFVGVHREPLGMGPPGHWLRKRGHAVIPFFNNEARVGIF